MDPLFDWGLEQEPHHPRARWSDPWTSQAADRDLVSGAAHRRIVLWIFSGHLDGLTHEEGQDLMEALYSGIQRGAFRKRATELEKDYLLVENTGLTRQSRCHRHCVVWRINAKGLHLWAVLQAGGDWPAKEASPSTALRASPEPRLEPSREPRQRRGVEVDFDFTKASPVPS